MIDMSPRSNKGETQVDETADTSSGNGRVLKTAPEPPPTSCYMSWLEIGQKVCGTVDKVESGYDAKNEPATVLTFVLAKPTYTFYKGERVDLEAGAKLIMTVSQWHLVPQIEALKPAPGLYLEITYLRDQGRMKVFKVDYDDSNVAHVPGKPIRLGGFPGTPRDEKPPF